MGKLTRRVKYIAKERRLSIPAEFLHRHGIERGDHLVLSARGEQLFAFPVDQFQQQRELAEQASRWFPQQDNPMLSVLREGVELRLGSQDRVVLPKAFPYQQVRSTAMIWDLLDGALVLTPEQEVAAAPRTDAASAEEQGSLMDLMLTAGQERPFDRDEAEHQLVEAISVGRIDHRDTTFGAAAIPSEHLVHSVQVEGIRQPLVLRELEDGYQVIDGFQRLAAARRLHLASVPAIVWRGIGEDDCRRLKLMEGPRAAPADSSPLQRLQSTLRLHRDQVGLNEIENITGRRKRTLQRYLRVAQNPSIRDAVEDGRLSIFKAEEILKAGVDVEEAISGKWTVKRIREEGKAQGTTRRRRNHGRSSGTLRG